MDGAFVTGGSGFIGGRLVERLVTDGVRVRALARSPRSAERVAALGAEPVAGDVNDDAALESGSRGCEVVFHAAAHVEDWGDPRVFHRINVLGTRSVVAAARRAGVRRVVHVGTEAALLAGEPLIAADESLPLRTDSPVLYSRTKAEAEIEALTGGGNGLETVVVRPRFVWGKGDTTLLPAIADQVRSGRFAWIGDGTHLTDTTHVDNVVEGLVLAATRGDDRGVWFLSDGEPIAFRSMITQMLETQGIEIPERSVPVGVAKAIATGGEALWRTLRLRGAPPVTRFAFWAASQECTLDTTRAREQLGYAPVRTRDEGMAELRTVVVQSPRKRP